MNKPQLPKKLGKYPEDGFVAFNQVGDKINEIISYLESSHTIEGKTIQIGVTGEGNYMIPTKSVEGGECPAGKENHEDYYNNHGYCSHCKKENKNFRESPQLNIEELLNTYARYHKKNNEMSQEQIALNPYFYEDRMKEIISKFEEAIK